MSDHSELKRLIEDQGKTWEEFKKANDELIKAKADGKAVADLEAKVAALTAALSQQDEFKAKVEEALKKAQRPGAGSGDADRTKEFKEFQRIVECRGHGRTVDEEAFEAYTKAYATFLRKNGNLDALSDTDRKALQAGIDADGGYLLPTPSVGRVIDKMRENSVLRQLATVVQVSTNDFEGLVDREDAASGWVGETSARPATSTPQLGKYRIEAGEMYAFPQLTQRIIDDAAINIEAWLEQKISQSFADRENAAFFNGDGVQKPRGLFTYPTAATSDATRPWGTFEHVATGVNGDFAASAKGDVLIDVTVALKTAYQAGARFLGRRTVLSAIRKFKDTTGQYLWQPSFQAGVPSQLIGYPLYLDENIPALATGSLSLAFGNFERAYTIIDRIGIRTLRDPYTNKPYVGLYATKRVGGAAVDFDAVKFVKFGS